MVTYLMKQPYLIWISSNKRKNEMKKVLTILLLVVLMGAISFKAVLANEGSDVLIIPWFDPGSGRTITVNSDDNIILGAQWTACSRGLAQAWTKHANVQYTIGEEQLLSSQEESRKYWSKPQYPTPFFPQTPDWCINGEEWGWAVVWQYEISLDIGCHQVQLDYWYDHKFHDGGSFDGLPPPDFIEASVVIPFEICVVE